MKSYLLLLRPVREDVEDVPKLVCAQRILLGRQIDTGCADLQPAKSKEHHQHFNALHLAREMW